MTTGLPIIDMTADESALADRIGDAARNIGFFYLTGHGIDAALTAAVFAGAQRFFALPTDVKEHQSIKRSLHNRGYVAIEEESLDPTKPADLKEAFNIGLDLDASDPRVVAGEPFRGVNLWPDIPGWRETMLAYFDAVWALGRRLHRAIALDLGLDPAFFDDKLDQPMATLRLLCYPPPPARPANGQIGAGIHSDYGDVTLLLTDEVGGLEVRKRDGEWIAAPHVDGAFVCNIGDCLMRWTNDVYVSTPHRVVNRAGRERYSVAFFMDPNPDAEVACLPTCQGPDRPPRYEAISAADYLRSRLDATYGFCGATAEAPHTTEPLERK
jgi:isopenicillin N synthase-like dioxygenase